jgi:hypothetical protein
VFCVLEFAKTESIVTVQRRFRTKYHTKPPMDKTVCEWYTIFQQSGCLCAVKQTGWLGPSAKTVERVPETCVGSPRKSTSCKLGIVDASVKCLEHSVQLSSHERILDTAVEGTESPGS